MTLGNQGLGKIVGPTGFGALDLNEGRVNGIVGGLSLAALDHVGHVGEALVDFLFVAGIAAEEKVVHVEAVQHDLVPHGFNRANTLERHAGVRACRLLHVAGHEVHQKQNSENGQNEPETGV